VRNIITYLVIFSAGINFLQAQRSVTVLSSKDSASIGQAYVLFFELNDSTGRKEKASALTKADGNAEVPFPGKVLVKISHLGFEEQADTLQPGEAKFFYLKPLNIPLEWVVITAQYTPDDPRNSVYPVEVISPEAIEKRGAVSLREALVQESNIRLSQDNILGSTMSLNGLGGEHVKILVDGIPVIGRENGSIDLSQLNLGNVKRIEVIEGPVSVQYGTNSLGGVINIITNHNSHDGWNARVNGFYESVGVYNAGAGIGFGKKKHSVDLSGGRNFFDGYSDIDTSRFKEWKPKEQYLGTLKYRYGFKRLAFTAKGDAFYEKITNRGKPRQPYNITAFDDYYYTQRYSGAASLIGEILQDHYLDQVFAYSYYSRFKNTFYKDLVTLENTMTPNPDDQDTTRFYSYLARGFVSRNMQQKIFNYQIGYDINIEQGRGKKLEDESQVIGDYAFFTSFNIKPVKSLALQAGIRWSYNTDYTPPVTPSFNLKWTPMDELVVRASYARGFRAPSLKELYLDFVDANHNIHGNKDLSAENSNNVNFSLDYERKERKHRITFLPTFFFNDAYDLIGLFASYNNEYTYLNVEHYQTIGSDIVIGYSLGDFSVEAGGGFTGRRISTESSFSFSPEATLHVGYIIPKAKISLSLFNKFNGKEETFYKEPDGGFLERKIDAYDILDFSLHRKFWQDRFSLTCGVKNILDVNNVSTTGGGGFHSGSDDYISIAWGRSFFASLKFSIDKRN